MTLEADGQELAALFKPTFTWFDYTTEKIGIINIPQGGNVTITLRGIQKGIKRNKEGKLKADEAFPDVQSLILVPTSLPTTSEATGIPAHFEGTRLFNGKDFEGWEGNDGEYSMAHFRIEKRAIVGGNINKDLEHNPYAPHENIKTSNYD